MEEDKTPPRRNNTLLLGGMRSTQSSSMRFTEPHGCTEEPPVRPHRSTQSSSPPPHTPWYSNGFIIMTKEEEERLARLEACSKRRLRRPSSPHIGFSFGTPRLGANLQLSVGKHPQGICLGNSHDHGAYP
jgi:hypothetical protein